MRTVATTVLAIAAMGYGAESDADKYATAAKDFAFEGMAINSSLDDFKEKYPDAMLNENKSDKSIDVSVFTQSASNVASEVEYTFFEGKLIQLNITYPRENIDKAGGVQIFFEKLLDRFGKWNPKSPGVQGGKFSIFWDFQEVERMLEFDSDNKVAHFKIVDTEAAKKVVEKKKMTADFGF